MAPSQDCPFVNGLDPGHGQSWYRKTTPNQGAPVSKLKISTALLAASALIVNGAASAQATALDEYIQWFCPILVPCR